MQEAGLLQCRAASPLAELSAAHAFQIRHTREKKNQVRQGAVPRGWPYRLLSMCSAPAARPAAHPPGGNKITPPPTANGRGRLQKMGARRNEMKRITAQAQGLQAGLLLHACNLPLSWQCLLPSQRAGWSPSVAPVAPQVLLHRRPSGCQQGGQCAGPLSDPALPHCLRKPCCCRPSRKAASTSSTVAGRALYAPIRPTRHTCLGRGGGRGEGQAWASSHSAAGAGPGQIDHPPYSRCRSVHCAAHHEPSNTTNC